MVGNQPLKSGPDSISLVDDAPRLRVIRTLEDAIRGGQIPAGANIPSERKLAERFNVARGTVRMALSALEQRGLLGSHNGRRQVMSVRSQGLSLMAQTVAVLTTNPSQLAESDQHVPGWERYIEVGAMEAVQRRQLHALALYTDLLLNPASIDRLLQDSPKAIMFSRRALESRVGQELLARLGAAGANVVVYGDSPMLQRFDRVDSDHELGGYELGKWLIGRGCRRMLRLYPEQKPRLYWMDRRNAGIERACREAAIEILPEVPVPDMPAASGDPAQFARKMRVVVGYLLEHFQSPAPPDAVLSLTDGDVSATAAACKLLGKTPNVDVLLAGYDNYWREAQDRQFSEVDPVVTVDKQNRLMGEQMVELALRRAAGELPSGPQLVTVAPKLVFPNS